MISGSCEIEEPGTGGRVPGPWQSLARGSGPPTPPVLRELEAEQSSEKLRRLGCRIGRGA